MKIRRSRKGACNHDVNSPDTTVVTLKRKFMVSPDTTHGVCTVCGKSISLVSEQEENSKEEKVE